MIFMRGSESSLKYNSDQYDIKIFLDLKKRMMREEHAKVKSV
jgi:hypothetical protein